MKFPAMRAVVLKDGAKCSIDVVHHVAQSYSRSVQPRAMKEAARVLRDGRRWALVDVDYDQPYEGDRCSTRYLFEVR